MKIKSKISKETFLKEAGTSWFSYKFVKPPVGEEVYVLRNRNLFPAIEKVYRSGISINSNFFRMSKINQLKALFTRRGKPLYWCLLPNHKLVKNVKWHEPNDKPFEGYDLFLEYSDGTCCDGHYLEKDGYLSFHKKGRVVKWTYAPRTLLTDFRYKISYSLECYRDW